MGKRNTSGKLWSSSRTALIAAALGCGSLTGVWVSTPAMAQAAQSTRPDAQIQADVQKQLTTAPGIQGQKISASTTGGVVTLTGSVTDEVTRQLAENAVSSIAGVSSVKNDLAVGDGPAPDATAAAPASGQPSPQAGQSASGWGPAGPPPDAVNGQIPPAPANDSATPPTQPRVGTTYGPPASGTAGGNYPQPGYAQPAYPQQGYPQQSYSQPAYPQQSDPQQGYSQQGGNYPARPAYQSSTVAPRPYVAPHGPVTIPAGAMLTVRLQNPIDARRIQPGDVFIANAARDVFEDGVLAIPIGATVEGHVVAVKKPGAFSGGGDIQVALSQLDMDGHSYPIATDVFSTFTPGKGSSSAANTIGGTAFGALLGAVIGGGPGAAIGAVAGGASGAAISTATPAPRSFIPAETMITFHLSTPAVVNPVSYDEATRLAASMPRPVLRSRPAYYGPPPGYYGYPAPYYR